jgi:hypothetical protein
MKKIFFFLAMTALVLVPTLAVAEDTMIFDSTDNYIGGCSLTATSTWTLPNDLSVTKIQLWYKWQTGETELPVTVTKNGADFATFTAVRSACDPYQTSWCNADYTINKTFPAGTYTTTIASAYQCLKPGSTGTVRLYGAAAATTNANTNTASNVVVTTNGNTNTSPNLVVTSNSNTNTAINQNANTYVATTNTNTTAANTNALTTTTVNTTSDDQNNEDSSNALTYILIGVIVILLIIIAVMFMNCKKRSIKIK